MSWLLILIDDKLSQMGFSSVYIARALWFSHWIIYDFWRIMLPHENADYNGWTGVQERAHRRLLWNRRWHWKVSQLLAPPPYFLIRLEIKLNVLYIYLKIVLRESKKDFRDLKIRLNVLEFQSTENFNNNQSRLTHKTKLVRFWRP